MDVLTDEVKEFQFKLEAILKEFLEQGSIEVYGNLKIVVTSFIRPSRIAFLKGNTIYISIKARGYPEFVLRYQTVTLPQLREQVQLLLCSGLSCQR